MATRAQKAAARRNIKKAQAALRRGSRRSRRSPGRVRRRFRAYRAKARAAPRGEKIGAAYQNAKMGLQVLSPVVDQLTGVVDKQVTLSTIPANLKTKITLSYGVGAGSAIAQRYVDSRFKQANALSQRSVTAWAPEIYAGLESANYWRSGGGVRGGARYFTLKTTGYDPMAGNFDIANATPYLALKYGGLAARKLSTKFPAIGDPIKKGLKMVGLTL